MRIAGVRMEDGRTAWVDAREWAVHPGDRAVLKLDGEEHEGEVFAAPGQLLGEVETPDGAMLRVISADANPVECGVIAGADMPPLGSRLSSPKTEGTVVGIDAVERTVMVRRADGTDVAVEWPEGVSGEAVAWPPESEDDRLLRESVGTAPAPRQ